MGLVSRYNKVFGSSLCKEGEQLYAQKTLNPYDSRDDFFAGEVWNDQECFEFEFNLKSTTVSTYCSCQKSKNKPCAHLWAAILWAEDQEVFKKGAGRGVRFAGTAAAEKTVPKINLEAAGLKNPSFQLPKAEVVEEISTERELIFVLNASQSTHFEKLVFEIFWHPTGDKSKIKPFDPLSSQSGLSSIDGELLNSFRGTASVVSGFLQIRYHQELDKRLMSLYEYGRFYTRRTTNQKQFKKIKSYFESEIYCDITQNEDGNYLARLATKDDFAEELLVFMPTFAVGRQSLVIGNNNKLSDLVSYLDEQGGLVPAWDAEEFLEKRLIPSGMNLQNLPGRLHLDENDLEPRGHLFVRTATFKYRDKEQLHADLSFDYGGKIIPEGHAEQQVLNFYSGSIFTRKTNAEQKLREELDELGFRFNTSSSKEEFGWKFLPVCLPEVVQTLARNNWIIIAEGKSYTAPQTFQLRLSSGSDWFDLEGEAVYDEKVLPLAELAKAAATGSNFVKLGDGQEGVLPEDWLKYYTVLTQLGEIIGDNLRFRKSQALIIEKLLFDKEESENEEFVEFCRKLKESDKVKSIGEPAGFLGKLRDYQQHGLAWMKFLGRNAFGGILADDMGLGKTVQVLALLQSEKNEQKKKASLLIVPSSLVFNWAQEAQKFTPDLKLLQYVGTSRRGSLANLEDIDLVITTYGTLRQDIEELSQCKFNYSILDEAQAIKNRDSSTAKAARLIVSEQKLSMSGTPVENSLSDLLSQFEFLNPGMTGHGRLSDILEDVKLNKETLNRLKEIFKPFILRRTKQQVAKELPPKIDQVLYCDMEEKQAEIYERLWKWYRQELLEKEKKTPEAGKKSGVDYLGALTRLRQAACHPALISEEWAEVESAKINVLFLKLKELVAEGRKVLIFSQYTSFLGQIREQVEHEKWSYCYLDGKTKDRAGEVEKFQTEDDIKLFLISLKAGGVGLNLTKAEYVFIMDPWWNPAIENQAIDRAYRIGQKNTVVAQRLICRNTVEEKVLKMQQTKKYLADSIIDEDADFSKQISLDDLRSLLD
ncbi:MAG: SNF2 family helicase [Lentisphaeraceae bacterium]|nr:SNF2 family helicase [Lentisphaeraceae bacterium]